MKYIMAYYARGESCTTAPHIFGANSRKRIFLEMREIIKVYGKKKWQFLYFRINSHLKIVYFENAYMSEEEFFKRKAK